VRTPELVCRRPVKARSWARKELGDDEKGQDEAEELGSVGPEEGAQRGPVRLGGEIDEGQYEQGHRDRHDRVGQHHDAFRARAIARGFVRVHVGPQSRRRPRSVEIGRVQSCSSPRKPNLPRPLVGSTRDTEPGVPVTCAAAGRIALTCADASRHVTAADTAGSARVPRTHVPLDLRAERSLHTPIQNRKVGGSTPPPGHPSRQCFRRSASRSCPAVAVRCCPLGTLAHRDRPPAIARGSHAEIRFASSDFQPLGRRTGGSGYVPDLRTVRADVLVRPSAAGPVAVTSAVTGALSALGPASSGWRRNGGSWEARGQLVICLPSLGTIDRGEAEGHGETED
jgi:hypothetical protein